MMISMEAKIEKTIFRTMSILLAVKNIHTLSKTTEYLKKKENGLQIFSKTMKIPPRLCVPDLLNEGRGLIMMKQETQVKMF